MSVMAGVIITFLIVVIAYLINLVCSPAREQIEVFEAMNFIESKGYVVVAFSPDEIKDANPNLLESYLIEKGNDYLANREWFE